MCVPSQNGLIVDPPQRQSATIGGTISCWPSQSVMLTTFVTM
jgi:hypothetical protein